MGRADMRSTRMHRFGKSPCSRVLVPLLLVGCARLTPAQAKISCEWHWGEPRVLITADRRHAYVEAASAVTIDAGVLLIGRPSFLWATPHGFDPPPGPGTADTAAYLVRLRENHGLLGVVLRADGKVTSVRFAESPRPMIRPRAARDGDGVVHLVWSQPTAGREADLSEARELWHSELRGAAWTTPSKLFEADLLRWTNDDATLLTTGTDVHIVVPYFRENSGAGIAYVRRLDGRWSVTAPRIPGLPWQATAQLSGPDSLVLAFVASDTRAGVPNGSHVFVTKMSARDSAWPVARRVQWSGLSGARSPKLFRVASADGSRNQLLLLWAHVPRGVVSMDTLYAMLSADDGSIWSVPTAFALPGGASTLAIERGSPGTIHIIGVLGDIGSARSTLFSTSWHHGRWREADSLPVGAIASIPTISIVGRDTLLLLWGREKQASLDKSSAVAPVGMYAIGAHKCTPSGAR
jgi:hypothetical protein